MGDLEPLREQVRRVVGCLTVKRHHRGWHARSTSQLGPPAIPDGCDFDFVRAPANGFFEAMNIHVFEYPSEVKTDVESVLILCVVSRRSSEGDREAAVHRAESTDLRLRARKK